MDSWLHYWRPEDVEKFMGVSGFKMDCTGSDQERFHKEYKKGDIVWFHSIVNGEHLLLGRLLLDKKLTKQEASEHVGRPFAASIKFEIYWVAEKPWHKIQRIPIREIAPMLEFVPSNPLPQNYNGQNFQAIRRLSDSDHSLIQDEWDIWME
tara:strand:- start:54 stop:506 length:453 start_codon:yes stop_codon:yes gene_type:complete